jgi:UDP-2,3-diacylglucosamine pyrophosphatase LpxH
MRQLLRKLLLRPVLWATNKFSSRPNKERVFAQLSKLYESICAGDKSKGLLIPFDITTGRFIIFSDHHKGAGDGADDFAGCKQAYLSALDYYLTNGYHYIALGDCEELWENLLGPVKKAHTDTFEKEAQFLPKNAFIKIFGNHDLFWDNDPLAPLRLQELYGQEVPIHDGVVLETTLHGERLHVFCTHGHQGDEVSDGNWFSKFFVSRIWAPLQSYLGINPNTPAYDSALKTQHNALMYEWSAKQKNLILITGHTHQPVFESLTHLERLYRQCLFAERDGNNDLLLASQKEIALRKQAYDNISPDYLTLQPSYFNSGCCCFSDGDMTGIEIEQECFRLIKWRIRDGASERLVLEEAKIAELKVGVEVMLA